MLVFINIIQVNGSSGVNDMHHKFLCYLRTFYCP